MSQVGPDSSLMITEGIDQDKYAKPLDRAAGDGPFRDGGHRAAAL